MIILIGESASGKSTTEKILANKYGYKRMVSYTTRPKRNGEIDGVDYHFISDNEFHEKFNKGFFAEVGCYNGWFYCTSKEQYCKNTVCVLTPHGFRQIKKCFGNDKDMKLKSFYIKVPRRDRLIKILQRGDNIEESYRRNLSDVGQFDGIEDEVDFTIENDNYIYSPNDIAYTIKELYEGGYNGSD